MGFPWPWQLNCNYTLLNQSDTPPSNRVDNRKRVEKKTQKPKINGANAARGTVFQGAIPQTSGHVNCHKEIATGNLQPATCNLQLAMGSSKLKALRGAMGWHIEIRSISR